MKEKTIFILRICIFSRRKIQLECKLKFQNSKKNNNQIN